jgi:hypothetical protein
MLKNLLFDKKNLHTTIHSILNEDEPKTEPKTLGNILTDKDNVELVEVAPIGADTTTIINSPSGIPSSEPLQFVHGGLDKAKEELLKFIDDDDDVVMEKYFDGKTTNNGMIPTDNCKPKQTDNMFPLSTTCDPNTQNMSKGDKVIKSDCDLLQDKKQLLILNEYENENSMNGGSLFGGLNAFDAFDTTYSQYTL